MKKESRTYCIDCGTVHQELIFPKKCTNPVCQREMYVNPIPVVVVIVPIIDQGVLLGRRLIEPQIGHWALPGGFVDEGESYENAAKRELREEMNLDYQGSFKLLGIQSIPSGAHMIIMLEAEPISLESVTFKANLEVSEMSITDKPMKLAFPIHTHYLQLYFKHKEQN